MATEKRLIDANILVRFAEALDKGEYDPALHAIRRRYLNGKGLKYLVDKCPTVDAVEIPDCRECFYSFGDADYTHCEGCIAKAPNKFVSI